MTDPSAEYAETMLKHNGKVKRTALKRVSYAECTNDDCPKAWTGGAAIGAAVRHVVGSGHTVRATYEAAFEYAPALSDTSITVEQVPFDPEAVAASLRSLQVPTQRNRSKVTSKKDVG